MSTQTNYQAYNAAMTFLRNRLLLLEQVKEQGARDNLLREITAVSRMAEAAK